MPSESKAQQHLAGMADAYKKGLLNHPSPEVRKFADSMTGKQVKEFAATPTKHLPEHVKGKK